MKRNIFAFACCLLSLIANAQDEYLHRMLIHNGDTLRYRILLPVSYNPAHKYPVIYFLHGMGERGSDNESQLIHGSKLFLKPENRKNFPAFVIFPQCPATDVWTTMIRNNSISRSFDNQREPTNAMKMLFRLVKNIEKSYPIKKNQVYLGGLSMGGMGVFEMAGRNPKLFAAAFPICGGGDTTTARKMNKIAWWVFHGDADEVVLPEYSVQMVNALKKERARVKFSLYPGVNHNSWDNAFAEPGLLPWLFSKKK